MEKITIESEEEVCQQGHQNKLLYSRGTSCRGYDTDTAFRKLNEILLNGVHLDRKFFIQIHCEVYTTGVFNFLHLKNNIFRNAQHTENLSFLNYLLRKNTTHFQALTSCAEEN